MKRLHLIAVSFLLAAAAARADVELATLDAGTGIRIDGAAATDIAGSAVHAGGDYNGDGIADLALSAPNADPVVDGQTLTNAGEVYVFYGHPTAFDANLSVQALRNGEAAGFIVVGDSANRFIGESISSVDLTGDGIDDLIIGAPRAGELGIPTPGNPSPQQSQQGLIYVVFGQREPLTANFNLVNLLTADNSNSGRGVFIVGGVLQGRNGASLASAGDFNGDGRDDLLIGTDLLDNGFNARGRSYVIYGRPSADAWPAALLLAEVRNGLAAEDAGIMIVSRLAEDHTGIAVAPAGDVNNDGMTDILIGSDLADLPDASQAGYVALIGGRTDRADDIDLRDPAPGGVVSRIFGAANDALGSSLASIGDFNGDGLADYAIGAEAADDRAGRVYILYGRAAGNLWSLTTFMADLIAAGDAAVLTGSPGERLGGAITAAGDVNGDGLADLLAGARDAAGGGRGYVITGRTGLTGTTPVSQVSEIIQGVADLDSTGRAVSAGDLNADGSRDQVIAAPFFDSTATNVGRSYVLFGDGDDAAPAMQGALSHAWYDTQAPGQGVVLEYGTSGGQPALFAAWYTFDDGQPLWLVSDLPILPSGARTVTSPLYVTRGTSFGAAFDTADVITQRWGEVRVTQTECGRLLWEYSRDSDGMAGRLVMRPVLADQLGLDLCTLTDGDSATLRARVAGTFWNPQRSGEGIVLDLEDRGTMPSAFFSWFTYVNNEQVWLVGSVSAADLNAALAAGDPVTVEVFTAGGADIDNFDPADVSVTPWGTVTLRFPACGQAQLDYDGAFDDGLPHMGSIDLVRFTDGLAGLSCN